MTDADSLLSSLSLFGLNLALGCGPEQPHQDALEDALSVRSQMNSTVVHLWWECELNETPSEPKSVCSQICFVFSVQESTIDHGK